MKRGLKLWHLAALAGIALLLALAVSASRMAPTGSQEAPAGPAEDADDPFALQTPAASEGEGESGGFQIAETETIDAGLHEDKSVYAGDDPDSLVYFYVTVRYGSEARGTNHTFNEVNNAIRFRDHAHYADDIYADALVQVGDENGPQPGMLGYGETASNATIRIRGNSSSLMPQKSYKLSLNDEAGLWRGQSNIALNKHIFDATRFRNKLYFDLARNLEDVPSLRTQFARLFIKDETSGSTQFVDYGLFTQAEVPTKKYLANHGLDRSGYLYKAISFNFEPNALIKNFDDPAFDQTAMDTVISCRGREDNTRLLEMIDAVNDTSRDINEVIDSYFDRDNYMQWLAFNLLMGNRDTTMQNFYLYSPLNGSKWYFIPWDGDTSVMRYEHEMEATSPIADWEWGVANYWGIILHQRFLKNADNRAELAAVVEEMHTWLNKDTVDRMAARYYETVQPYLYVMPDVLNLQHTREEVEYLISRLGDEVEENYQNFLDSLTDPMPFWMYAAETVGNDILLTWEPAYDFEGRPFTYHVTVSRSPDLSAPILDESGLTVTSLAIPRAELGSGEFYWRVTARRSDGAVAEAMNEVIVNDVYYLGVYNFAI